MGTRIGAALLVYNMAASAMLVVILAGIGLFYERTFNRNAYSWVLALAAFLGLLGASLLFVAGTGALTAAAATLMLVSGLMVAWASVNLYQVMTRRD